MRIQINRHRPVIVRLIRDHPRNAILGESTVEPGFERDEIERLGVGNPNLASAGLHRHVEQHRADIADGLDDPRLLHLGIDDEDIVIRQIERHRGAPVATVVVAPTALGSLHNDALFGHSGIRNIIEIDLPRPAEAHGVFARD